MKKFFGIGLLALLTTAYLTSSCSRDEFSGSLLEAKKNAFNENFISEYGRPADNHDWGFGLNNGTRAFTRAFSNYLGQSGADKNLNEWGDTTRYNLEVPPALTDGQKERVRKYFQTHSPITYVDPHYTHFFIQQVYKGGTSPANNPIMGNYTTEKYVMADANVNNGVYDQTVGSSKMDYLTVGLDANGNALHHVNDFNNGDWGNGQSAWVLNEGEGPNNHANYDNGHVHQDKITLVINSNTKKVGYANDNDSQQHNNACALVKPKDIDDWANAQTPIIGQNVYYNIVDENNNVIVDNRRWNRSFVGLDFEGYDPYAYDANGQKIAPKVGDVTNSVKFVWNGTRYYEFNDEIKAKTLKEMLGLTKDIYYLNDQTSHYAGKSSHFNSQGDIESSPSGADIRANLLQNGYTQDQVNAMTFNTNEKVLDLTKILQKINANCMPRQGESFLKWYYDIEDRGRDGIYSDWIVTLTEAREIGNNYVESDDDDYEIVLKQAGRVFCEDLGTVSSSDIDYNDAVFDAWLYVKRWNNDESTDQFHKAFIQPLAAGGTILLKIADVNIHKAFGFDNDDVMINTYREGQSIIGEAKHKEYGTDFSTMPDKIVITDASYVTGDDGEMNIFYIPITVRTSDNKAVELTSSNSVSGGSTAPLKFMAPLGTPWAAERVKFGLAYPMFSEWVANPTETPWTLPSETATYDLSDLPAVSDYAPTEEEIGAATNTPVTPTNPSGQGEEEESDPTFSSVTGTDLNIDPTTLTPNSSLTLPAASFNNVSAATVYIYGTGNGEVLVNGVSATTESSAPRFGFTRSATPVVKVCQLGPSNLKTNRVVVSGYNFRVVKCSMVNQTGNYSVSEPSGKGDIIYNTSTILDWGDNGGAVTITNDALKSVQVGSKIRVFGIGYASSYWEVQAFGFNTTGGWNQSTKLSPQDGTSFSGNGAKEIVFPITTQAQANMVKGGSIVVQGYNFIMKYVTVENPSSSGSGSGESTNNYVGTVLWDDGGGEAQIANTLFVNADAQVNNVIRVYVDSPSSGYWHVNLVPGGWNGGSQPSDWEPASFTQFYNPQPDNFPGYVDYKIKTATALSAVRTNGLIVQSTGLSSGGILAVTLIK